MTSEPTLAAARFTLTFLGANATVTGSRYLIEADGARVLVDCGLFQGYKTLRLRNWAPFPVDPASIDAVVLTHAHLDHSGYLPRLIRSGFRGRVWCTEATRSLCRIMLPDSGRLLEEEADVANRKGSSRHHPAEPLYRESDALESLHYLQGMPFEQVFEPVPGLRDPLSQAGTHPRCSSGNLRIRGGQAHIQRRSRAPGRSGHARAGSAPGFRLDRGRVDLRQPSPSRDVAQGRTARNPAAGVRPQWGGGDSCIRRRPRPIAAACDRAVAVRGGDSG